MRTDSGGHLGTRKIERQGKLLLTTGPERTLVEGFRRPRLAGGLEELVTSASGFAVLDLTLLDEILQRYSIANLWAATGWFLERFRKTFHVPDEFLNHMEQHRPRSPHYLERNRRGGVLAARWNLILPKDLMQWEGRYEP
jgi:predicted transcriptional regulator of viral defense system